MARWWYLLRLHPNYDLKAERQLAQSGAVAYVPKETRELKTGWNRKRSREVPIFPGTMFIPDFEADLPRLKAVADGIGGFVRVAGEPLRISLPWMERIRAFEDKVRGMAGQRKYKIGQRVRITSGPFNHWEAKITRLDSRYRLSALIDAFGREILVELEEGQVEAV
jgi:transcriptional antiterminator NusG